MDSRLLKVCGLIRKEAQVISRQSPIYRGFPKLGVPFLGVPIIRTIVFWGLYWGTLILGNYHI